jgi:CRP-like cAMP-binding protein
MADRKAPDRQKIIDRRSVPAGTVVIRQGEGGNAAFLIESGTVRVTVEKDGRQVELAKLSAGQIFGEMALVFEEEDRAATVEALEDCSLIVITRRTFDEKLKNSDPTVRAIVPMLVQRILQANRAVSGGQPQTAKDLIDSANVVYRHVLAAQPTDEARAQFESEVGPKLDEFVTAARQFKA